MTHPPGIAGALVLAVACVREASAIPPRPPCWSEAQLVRPVEMLAITCHEGDDGKYEQARVEYEDVFFEGPAP